MHKRHPGAAGIQNWDGNLSLQDNNLSRLQACAMETPSKAFCVEDFAGPRRSDELFRSMSLRRGPAKSSTQKGLDRAMWHGQQALKV